MRQKEKTLYHHIIVSKFYKLERVVAFVVRIVT